MNEGNVSRAEILPLLKDVKIEGEWVMAFCPVHADGQKHGMKGGRSLGLSKAGVLKCYAGCDFKTVMETLRGRQAKQEQLIPAATNKTLTATYEYRDQDGILRGIKDRIEWPGNGEKPNKEFVWRVHNGRKMHEMPLWGAELLKDVPLTQRVWFTEGEKACEALRARNEVAVTGGWGSGQKTFGDAFEVLRGRNVWLWPDNDDPGRKYLVALKPILTAIVGNLKVIQPRNMPEAGDAHDFFAAGRSIEEFVDVSRQTTVVADAGKITVTVPTSKYDVEFVWSAFSRNRGEFNAELTVCPMSLFGGFDPIHTRINVLSQSATSALRLACESAFGGGRGDVPMDPNWASAINRAIDRVRRAYEELRGATVSYLAPSFSNAGPPTICGDYVVDGGGTFLFGPPGKGKSTIALLMAVSIDANSDALWSVFQRKVMYINLERSAASMALRLARANYVLEVEEERPLLMLNARGSILSDLLDTIRAAIAQHGVQGVFLDSVSRAGYGDLNANDVANKVADALNSLGVWWVAVAHSPRGDDTHIYGSVMQDAAADIMVSLSSEAIKDEMGIGLQITKANDQAVTGDIETIAFGYDMGGIVTARRAKTEEFVGIAVREKVKLFDAIVQHLGRIGIDHAGHIALEINRSQHEISRILNKPGNGFIRQMKRGSKGEVYYSLEASV